MYCLWLGILAGLSLHPRCFRISIATLSSSMASLTRLTLRPRHRCRPLCRRHPHCRRRRRRRPHLLRRSLRRRHPYCHPHFHHCHLHPHCHPHCHHCHRHHLTCRHHFYPLPPCRHHSHRYRLQRSHHHLSRHHHRCHNGLRRHTDVPQPLGDLCNSISWAAAQCCIVSTSRTLICRSRALSGLMCVAQPSKTQFLSKQSFEERRPTPRVSVGLIWSRRTSMAHPPRALTLCKLG
mmetsp:Transcript_1821/g.2959  ORF Transcript_1821/g.2959 Transcript_1821/m.2959 type:complete len:235 (-) Transcript_1821:778-1482(-)